VSVATSEERATTYLGGQPTVVAEQVIRLQVVEHAALMVLPCGIFTDHWHIQPIQLCDTVAGDTDELAMHVLRGVL
jgi:hypothetical protein